MSYLIVGGTSEERKEKARKIARIEFRISNFDTILIEGETSIGIVQIRALAHSLSLKPYNSPYKAAVVHPGEILTLEAQNALLKTLEEENESSVLILTAPYPWALLPTVVSRCQIIRLPTKVEISLNQEEFDSVFRLLSLSVFRARVGERLNIIGKIGKDREKIKLWLTKQLFFWREILLIKTGVRSNPQYVNMLTYCKEGLETLTSRQVVGILRNLQETQGLVKQNVNPRLALEIFLLDLPKIL